MTNDRRQIDSPKRSTNCYNNYLRLQSYIVNLGVCIAYNERLGMPPSSRGVLLQANIQVHMYMYIEMAEQLLAGD